MTADANHVLGVVVAYQRTWEQVRCAQSLLRQLTTSRISPGPSSLALHRVLVYDNSPEPMAAPSGGVPGVDYVHDARNSGTRGAYVRALREARSHGIGWLLLVDHDTALPPDYLSSASVALAEHPDVLLPRVVHRGREISPARVTACGSVRPLRKSRQGDRADADRSRLTAVASGVVLKTEVLGLIDDMPDKLWLDYVDHWLFHRIGAAGFRIGTIDVTLDHHLSIVEASDIPKPRLRSIWDSERIFIAALGWRARCCYPLRLLFRLARLTVTSRRCAAELLAWMLKRGSIRC